MVRSVAIPEALLLTFLALPALAAQQAPAPGSQTQPPPTAAPARPLAHAPAAPRTTSPLPTQQPAPPGPASGSGPTGPLGMPLSPSSNAAPAGSSPAQPNAVPTTPHITIATPAPAPAPWPWQQRVSWGANLLLVLLLYIAIMMAISLLRKIERHTEYVEIAAQAAGDAARAAFRQAEAMVRAERPWILMTVRPSQDIDDGFAIMATNRGRGPAMILSKVDEIVSAIDQAHLGREPEFRNDPVAPADPMILLPGESAELLTFSRADVQRICDTEERLARVENWEEKIFLYGRVTYCDLAAPDQGPVYESYWCAWYIHGRQKSGMVMAGSPAYNRHT